MGRSTVINPGIATLDFSLQKNWHLSPLGEDGNIQFRAEFFNVFNRANFGIPEDEVFSSKGRARCNAGEIIETNTTARQVQLALRLTF